MDQLRQQVRPAVIFVQGGPIPTPVSAGQECRVRSRLILGRQFRDEMPWREAAANTVSASAFGDSGERKVPIPGNARRHVRLRVGAANVLRVIVVPAVATWSSYHAPTLLAGR
jgi:hypothetical protein